MLKLFRRLEAAILGPPADPTWRAQTPVPRFTGYDPALQARAIARSRACRFRVVTISDRDAAWLERQTVEKCNDCAGG